MDTSISHPIRVRLDHVVCGAGLSAVIAGLYFAAGWVGLLLAVPPGYSTLVWPPSGVAMGAALIAGARVWPGIFLGAAILNIVHADAITPTTTSLAIAIAAGSTLQSLGGARLANRLFGSPIRFRSAADLVVLAIALGPVTCILAASVGQIALLSAGLVDRGSIVTNWATWWMGDTLGVLVFLPLVVLSPWHNGTSVQ